MQAMFYMHTGSANHGCEAIVRSSYELNKDLFDEVVLYSKCPKEDKEYITDLDLEIKDGWTLGNKKSLRYILMALRMKIFKQKNAYMGYQYKELLDAFAKNMIAFSIGGDNYCYDGMPELLAYLNRKANKQGAKTVLWGASIEPDLLKDPKIKQDLQRYTKIIVRESISYQALLDNDIVDNVCLYPDPAFTLSKTEVELPNGLIEKQFVGLNISPLIMDCEEDSGLAFRNYEKLIAYILEKTTLKIALIPHVVWEDNNDMTPLTRLYEEYKDKGRVVLIQDMDATRLKSIISKARFFVGARTHATIAAYSTMVPTLVCGYSVKARGIAKDLFGTEENYVLSVQNLRRDDELVNGFMWLIAHETEMQEHLGQKIPRYIERAKAVRLEIRELVSAGGKK